MIIHTCHDVKFHVTTQLCQITENQLAKLLTLSRIELRYLVSSGQQLKLSAIVTDSQCGFIIFINPLTGLNSSATHNSPNCQIPQLITRFRGQSRELSGVSSRSTVSSPANFRGQREVR